MNVRSKYDTDDEGKEPKKRYLYLGFSSPSQFGGAQDRSRFMGSFGNPRAFDAFFEKLGIKKKVQRDSKEE